MKLKTTSFVNLRSVRTVVAAASLIAGASLLAGCDVDDGPLEEAGAELDTTLEQSRDQIDDAIDDVSDGVEDFERTTDTLLREASKDLEAQAESASLAAQKVETAAREKLDQ